MLFVTQKYKNSAMTATTGELLRIKRYFLTAILRYVQNESINVMPLKNGIHAIGIEGFNSLIRVLWIPTFVGMTVEVKSKK